MKWNSSVSTKLKVAYANLAPFVAVEETKNGDVLGGFIPQIMEMVAKWMNLELTYIREPYDTYGSWVNNTWNGMVGMLYRNEVDLILNPILPTDEFLDFLYYTNPITIEAYTILAGKKSEELGLFLYFSVLDKSVWIGIIIALFVISVTSAALFRRTLLPYSFQCTFTLNMPESPRFMESNLAINRLAWTKIDHTVSQVKAFQSIPKVEKGGLCIIHGHLIIKDRLSKYFRKKGTCNLHLSKNYFYPFSLMMAIHRRLPPVFAETFNRGVTRLVDADITGKWFEAALEVSDLCTSYSDNTLKPLGLEHIFGVLVLWAAGLAISFVVLILEMKISKRKKVKATDLEGYGAKI
ncbi:Glutamate receptor ionotropic like protein [Argiope bruennichi]|uniref:Glutamate receptor ionotropic like protein n=1 Tax=Argiope bruennichi TaxID=94029 RepID=A0A8T0EKL2_ARGBR|nr:Glutamate receptor ionotropic like protein [Argiope bruennichi]